MPKEIAHWIFAEEAQRSVPNNSFLHVVISNYYLFYLLGAVLFDSPFYSAHRPRRSYLGDVLHGKSKIDARLGLIALAKQYDISQDGALLALLAGAITHRSADILFHPLVFALSGNDRSRHFEFETYLDIHMIQKYRQTYQKNFLRVHQTKGRVHVLMRKLWHALVQRPQLLRAFYPATEMLSNKQLYAMLKRHGRLQNLLHNRLLKMVFTLCARASLLQAYNNLIYPIAPFKKKNALTEEICVTHPVTGERCCYMLSALTMQFKEMTHALFSQLDSVVSTGATTVAAFCATLPNTSLYHGLETTHPHIYHTVSQIPIQLLRHRTVLPRRQ